MAQNLIDKLYVIQLLDKEIYKKLIYRHQFQIIFLD